MKQERLECDHPPCDSYIMKRMIPAVIRRTPRPGTYSADSMGYLRRAGWFIPGSVIHTPTRTQLDRFMTRLSGWARCLNLFMISQDWWSLDLVPRTSESVSHVTKNTSRRRDQVAIKTVHTNTPHLPNGHTYLPRKRPIAFAACLCSQRRVEARGILPTVRCKTSI